MNWRRLSGLLLIVQCILLWSGCAAPPRKLTDPAMVGSNYVIGRTYTVRNDIFIFKAKSSYTNTRHSLGIPGLNQNGPQSISAYEQGDKTKWPSVAGVIRAGTDIQITTVLLVDNPIAGKHILVFAVIKEGEFAGTAVDITSISKLQYAPNRVPRMVPMVHLEVLE